jgi:hypothetical protein
MASTSAGAARVKSMKPRQKILGYVVTRDAWPMVGLAVLNALRNGVSHVVIVDHRSNNKTHQYLRDLQHSRPDEISLIRTNTTHFLQSATYVSVLKHFPIDDYDWVYTFDSDEFIYVNDDRKLSDSLNDVSQDVNAIRYEVINFVVPNNFDSTNAADFLRIDQRAVLSRGITYDPDLAFRSLVEGKVNFFDWPFPSKVITRTGVSSGLQKGGHSAVGANAVQSSSELYAMHVPFSSKTNLERRSSEGREMKTRRYAPGESWQQRALHEIEQNGDLNDFWLSHTILDDQIEISLGRKRPQTKSDRTFARAMKPVVEELILQIPRTEIDPESEEPISSSSSIDTVIEIVDEFEWFVSPHIHQQLATDHQQLATDHQQLATDHQQLATNLDLALDAQRHLATEVRSLRRSRAFRIGRILLSPITGGQKLLSRRGSDIAQD